MSYIPPVGYKRVEAQYILPGDIVHNGIHAFSAGAKESGMCPGIGWQVYRKDDAAEHKALTYDDGKPPLAQIPWAAIRELSMVQLYGHSKYKDFNNYRKGMEITRNLSCAIRHISEFIDGNDNDSESGRSHLGHAMCRIAFVLQNLADGVAIDDRFKP